MTRREMMARMGSDEFGGWIAYYRVQHEDEKQAEMAAKAKATATQQRSQARGKG